MDPEGGNARGNACLSVENWRPPRSEGKNKEGEVQKGQERQMSKE